MTQKKPFSICAHCGASFKTNKTQAFCSLPCSFLNKAPSGKPNECWPWQGAKNDVGYGQIAFQGRRYYTHRISYEMENGPLGDMRACHTCDNPPCCNPNHIKPGSQAFNLSDMRSKGRGANPPPAIRGQMCPLAKFTDAQVEAARQLLKSGWSRRMVREATGISKSHVARIDNGHR